MAEPELEKVLDSEQHSNTSGKGASNPEKDVMASGDRDAELDIEKQAQDETESQQKSRSVPEQDPNIVEFDGPNDMDNPKNWHWKRKLAITASLGAMTFVVTFSSSIFAVCIGPVSNEYNIGTVTAALGVCLFLLGFVLGPVVFGPMSEVYGRRIPLFSGYVVFAIFQIPVATAHNVETIMIARFISGFAASAPLAVIGGALADMFDPIERTYAVCAFAGGTFCGPVVGPILGGFVTESYLGWRWTAWFTLILAGLFGAIGIYVVPETSGPRILQKRAQRLRFETKNWAFHAKADENEISFETIRNVYLMRPWKMIVQEPILACLTAYMSYIYGVLYLLFEAYPISFHEERGWSLGVSSLPYISFIIGIGMGTSIQVYSTKVNFAPAFRKHGKPVPEERLPPMIAGAIILPIALFWFAWTSFPSITWVPQVISSAFIGCGMLITFWQGVNYIIDCYGFYANSAIAINTFLRSIAGAVFPLFATKMYHNLGVPWATSLLAFLCVAFAPVPVLFYKYGARIRQSSRFTPTG